VTLTVREVLEIEELRRARVEAGVAGLNRQVLWVDIVDIPEIWLSGGEIVLTSGAGWPKEARERAEFLAQFDEAGAAGVIVALGRFISRLDEEMRAMADRRRMPLISVPWETPFTQVTRAIAQKALEVERSLYFLLAGERSAAEVEEMAEGLGLKPQAQYLCLIAAFRGEAEGAPNRVGTALQRAFGDAGVRYLRLDNAERAVILLESERTPVVALEWAQRFRRELARFVPAAAFYVGVGLPHRGFLGLRRSYREALAAVKFGSPTEGVVPFERVEAASLLESVPTREALADFWRRTLGKVLAERPDLYETLVVLARQGYNQRLTAQELHVHKNTLRYRVEHLEQVLGLSLSDPDVRFRIRLAAEAATVLEIGGAEGPGAETMTGNGRERA
jgi:DNA-binding PucR family transcriptional regulator